MFDRFMVVWFFCLLVVICVFVDIDIYYINQNSDDFKKRVKKVTYEGHEYLIYDRGVCHYPECCKCQTKGETNE